jgi:hypothetical protein
MASHPVGCDRSWKLLLAHGWVCGPFKEAGKEWEPLFTAAALQASY